MDGKGAADAMAKKGSAEEAAHFKKVEAEQLAKIKAQKEAAEKKWNRSERAAMKIAMAWKR